ncbi:hypothetical protein RQP46_009097 [Phenoliferia psychrophenolica]
MSLALPVLLSAKHLSQPAAESSDTDSGCFSESVARESSPETEEEASTEATLKRKATGRLPSALPTGERCPQLTDVSLEQLRAANTPSKAWVAVRGKVYNLTKFAARHPGGKAIILMGAGKDVTPLFETAHGPLEERTLAKFLVGTLVGKEVPAFPVADEFSRVLKARVAAHFKAEGIDPKHSPVSFLRYGLTIVLLAIVLGLQWHPTVQNSALAFWSLAVLYGCLQVEVAVSFVHDGSHGSIGHNPRIWTTLAALHDFINGTSSVLWIYQHVLSHHCYTNIEALDVDIDTSDKDFRRMKDTQAWHSFYRFQALYVPFVYVLLGTSVRIGDVFRAFVDRTRGTLTVNAFSWAQCGVFWGGKAFFFASRLALPFFLLPGVSPWKVLGAFVVSDAVFSFVFGLISQASHAVDCVEWPSVDPVTGNIESDWMRLQVETAQDYAHGSALTTFLVGALNYQAVHHLFPQVAQPHVPGIAPIVIATAKEFGVKYTIKPTLWAAIGGHIGL